MEDAVKKVFAMLALFSVAPALAAAPKAALQPKIEAVRAQLFYEKTGVLSPNVAPPANFAVFNAMIAEGDAKEPANDVLVSVALSVPGDEANVDTPLELKITGKGGKVITRRVFRSLFFKGGKSVKAMFAPDAVCIGKAKIEASIGSESRAVNVEFNCGE